MLVSVVNSRGESGYHFQMYTSAPMGTCPGRALGGGAVWLPRRAKGELIDQSPSAPHLTKAALGVGIFRNN